MLTVVPLQVPHGARLSQLVGDDVQVGAQLPAGGADKRQA